MFSERLVGLNGSPVIKANSIDANRGLFVVTTALTKDANDGATALAFAQACMSVPGDDVGRGADDLHRRPTGTARRLRDDEHDYSHVVPPNGLSLREPGGDPKADTGGGGGVRGDHAEQQPFGGVNVGFADGSVKFIKNTCAAGLVGDRDPPGERGRQCRCVLSRRANAPGSARAGIHSAPGSCIPRRSRRTTIGIRSKN